MLVLSVTVVLQHTSNERIANRVILIRHFTLFCINTLLQIACEKISFEQFFEDFLIFTISNVGR